MKGVLIPALLAGGICAVAQWFGAPSWAAFLGGLIVALQVAGLAEGRSR